VQSSAWVMSADGSHERDARLGPRLQTTSPPRTLDEHRGLTVAAGPSRSATVQQVSDALQLTIRFEPGEDGWIIASIPEVPGALSQGRTREEARANVIDALRLMLTPEPDAPPSDSEPLQLTIAA
jgi:predicted RNase H-like HicB family nuclease